MFGMFSSSKKLLHLESEEHPGRERSDSRVSAGSSNMDGSSGTPHRDKEKEKEKDKDREKDREKEKEKGERSYDRSSEKSLDGGSKSRWSLLNPITRPRRATSVTKKIPLDNIAPPELVEKKDKHNEPFSTSVEFLNTGFQELVKCRKVPTSLQRTAVHCTQLYCTALHCHFVGSQRLLTTLHSIPPHSPFPCTLTTSFLLIAGHSLHPIQYSPFLPHPTPSSPYPSTTFRSFEDPSPMPSTHTARRTTQTTSKCLIYTQHIHLIFYTVATVICTG